MRPAACLARPALPYLFSWLGCTCTSPLILLIVRSPLGRGRSTSSSCISSADALGSASASKAAASRAASCSPWMPTTRRGRQDRLADRAGVGASRLRSRRSAVCGGALVAEKDLQVSEVHTQREQVGCDLVAQQMRGDTLGDFGRLDYSAHDLVPARRLASKRSTTSSLSSSASAMLSGIWRASVPKEVPRRVLS